MNSLCNSLNVLTLKPLIQKTDLHFSKSLVIHEFPTTFKAELALKSSQCCIKASSSGHAGTFEIDMVRNKQGIYTQKQHNKVVVLWDLDNKPPRGPPYDAAMSLRRVAEKFGEVTDMSAYANRHAFIHLPQWVIEERRERKHLDILERRGQVFPTDTYVCGVCGRKCKTNLDLKKHFKQLHERERQKKLNRMRSLKGKKRQRYKERYINGNEKYNETARNLLRPKIGYGLGSELRRAGVFVKTVKDKPQAADWALKRQMQHSMSSGIDWMVLVTDDKDFKEMLRKAKEANLGTIVVGDSNRGLGQHADLWVPWIGVENGELSEKDLVPRRSRSEEFGRDDSDLFLVAEFDGGVGLHGESDLDSVVNELVAERTEFGGVRISVFSEEEEEEEDLMSEEVGGDYLLEDEEIEENYGYF
ncbi:C2H2-like zinc finger protein [Melia azedarach]|uniref:C2H2-like zinc finger protein n=1 Tax=Melia azedarach TaxID=155640 RepID=A0ACC1WTJ2_MELAZ|nr:C2H2-like zinc finger protein [Melia azedarach]